MHSFWDAAGPVITLLGYAGPAVLAFLFFANAWASYRLLRLYHMQDKRGGRISVLGQLAATVLADPLSAIAARTLFKRTRMRLEFEVLKERPPPVLREDAAEQDRRPARLARWRRGLAALFDRASDETITIATPQALHDRFEEVDRYFDCLEILRRPKNEMQFETKIKIEKGFVAPLHLVAGVLRKFDEDWEKVLKVYEKDRVSFSAAVGENTAQALMALRDVQLFIFDCWLLWGPSIPICAPGAECAQFAGGWTSLQYGFGDENNSVEIVGTTSFLESQWAALNPAPGVRAVGASVVGHIANSRFLAPEEAEARMGRAIAASWNADQDGKLLVLVSEAEQRRAADQEKHETRELKIAGTGMIHPGATADSYYSAYLWAIFVVLREEPGAATASERAWVPAHYDPQAPRRSAKPWLDMLPFFEHGNIADRDTYAFLKRQLAEKAVSGLAKIVSGGRTGADAKAAAGAYPLRFAYACSIDHTGCTQPLKFEANLAAGESGFPDDSLPDLMWRRVRDAHPELLDVVRFDYYGPRLHPHSACALPAAIVEYFDHVEALPKVLPA